MWIKTPKRLRTSVQAGVGKEPAGRMLRGHLSSRRTLGENVDCKENRDINLDVKLGSNANAAIH